MPRPGEFIYVAFIGRGFPVPGGGVNGRPGWVAGASGRSFAGVLPAVGRDDTGRRVGLGHWTASPYFGGINLTLPAAFLEDRVVATLGRDEPGFRFGVDWVSPREPDPFLDFPLQIARPENLERLDTTWLALSPDVEAAAGNARAHLVQQFVNQLVELEGIAPMLSATEPWLPVRPVQPGAAYDGAVQPDTWELLISDKRPIAGLDLGLVTIHEVAHALALPFVFRRAAQLLGSVEQIAEVLRIPIDRLLRAASADPRTVASPAVERLVDHLLGQYLTNDVNQVVMGYEPWQTRYEQLTVSMNQAERTAGLNPAVHSWLRAELAAADIQRRNSLYRYWQLPMEQHAFQVDRILRRQLSVGHDWSQRLGPVADALTAAGWPTDQLGRPGYRPVRSGMALRMGTLADADPLAAAHRDVYGQLRLAGETPVLSIRLRSTGWVAMALRIAGSREVGQSGVLAKGHLIELEFPPGVKVTPAQARRWAGWIEAPSAGGLVLHRQNLTAAPDPAPHIIGLRRNGRHNLPPWSDRIAFLINGFFGMIPMTAPLTDALVWTAGIGYRIRAGWYLSYVDGVAWVRPEHTADRFPTILGDDGIRRRIVADPAGRRTFAVGASDVDLIPYDIYAWTRDAEQQLGEPGHTVGWWLRPVETTVQVPLPEEHRRTANRNKWALFDAVFGPVDPSLVHGDFDPKGIGPDGLRLLVEVGSLAGAAGAVENISEIDPLDPRLISQWRNELTRLAHESGVDPALDPADARQVLLFTAFTASVGVGVGSLSIDVLRLTRRLLDVAGLPKVAPADLHQLVTFLARGAMAQDRWSLVLRTALSFATALPAGFTMEQLRNAIGAADRELVNLVRTARRGPHGAVWWLGSDPPVYPAGEPGVVIMAYPARLDGWPTNLFAHNPGEAMSLVRLVDTMRSAHADVRDLPIRLHPVGQLGPTSDPGLRRAFEALSARLGLNAGFAGADPAIGVPIGAGLLAAAPPIALEPVTKPTGLDPDPPGVRLPRPIVRMLRAASWAEAERTFYRSRATLVNPETAELLARIGKPRRLAAVQTAIELELAAAGSPTRARVTPTARQPWEIEPVPTTTVDGRFVFDYLGQTTRAGRLLWDGLLLSLTAAKSLSFNHGRRLVALRTDPDAPANAQAFTAFTMLLDDGPAALPAARKLVEWENCKLHPDDKLAWLTRAEWLRATRPATLNESLDSLANALADCG